MARKNNHLWLYLVLAYGLAWLLWIPIAVTGRDYQTSPLLTAGLLLGVFGPGAAGIVVTYLEGGREGGQDFWRRLVSLRRIRSYWWLIIFLLWPLVHLVTMGLGRLAGSALPQFEFARRLVSGPVDFAVIVVLYLVQAALEELGWRGYMLERLLSRMKPLPASLVVGVSHALWHLPLFWVVGTNQIEYGLGPDLWLFLGFVTVASSIYSSWSYVDSNRSTLAAVLFHFAANLSLDIFVVPGPQTRMFQAVAIVGAVIIAVLWQVRNRQASHGFPVMLEAS